MNKLTKPVPEDDDDFGSELSDADIDAWIERNREPLKEALQVARDQMARGEYAELDIEDIIAEGRARFAASKKQA
jgi:antitoxin ParD1/3/4